MRESLTHSHMLFVWACVCVCVCVCVFVVCMYVCVCVLSDRQESWLSVVEDTSDVEQKRCTSSEGQIETSKAKKSGLQQHSKK